MTPVEDHGYRVARLDDIPAIVRIHQAAFGAFFMTQLGPRFLGRYYRLVCAFPSSVLWVKEGKGGLVGFVAGFTAPAAFYRTLRQHRWAFLLDAIRSLLANPRLILRLIRSYGQAGRAIRHQLDGVCELSSIAVLPTNAGAGIGRGLVDCFIRAVQGRADRILLTTDANGNDAVNAFYRHQGFVLDGQFAQSRNRLMNRYRFDLPRADSLS